MFSPIPTWRRAAIRKRAAESGLDYLAYAPCAGIICPLPESALSIFWTSCSKRPRIEAALREDPSNSQRHENRVHLKNDMLRELWDEPASDPQGYETIRLRISDDLRQIMEDRLILLEDLQQVIDYAEKTGLKLRNRDTGRFLAHYKPASVTYWVEIRADGRWIHRALTPTATAWR